MENLEQALLQTHTEPRSLVIRLHRVPFMDITGLQTLAAVIEELRGRDVRVLLCEARPRVDQKLRKAKVIDALAAGDYCATLDGALARCADRSGTRADGPVGAVVAVGA